jgi:glyoxylase-like metal-dependent hydrolase (beta-lactamase superfamily II)
MQITPHIHALKIPFQVKPAPGVVLERFVYVYLICGRRVTLIDSGVAGCEGTILDYLRSIGREPAEIAMLVLTHSHPDHVGAARAIQQATGCRVAAHAAEQDWIEDVDLQARQRPVPGFATLVGGSVRVDQVLQHGDTIDLEDTLRLEVLHTPGHSRGSISLVFPQDQALFSGDAIPLAGDIPIYEDPAALVQSIRCLRDKTGIDVVLSSWDAPRRGEQVRCRMDEALAYLQRIHNAVLKVAADNSAPEPMVLCRQVLADLGVPAVAANPLVAKSFLSHLALRENPDLLIG